MLVDFTLNTGLYADAASINKIGDQYAGNISINSTGNLRVTASLNSQTLLESLPTEIPMGFETLIENSGDFYITGADVKLTDLTGISASVFLFDEDQTGNSNYAFGGSGYLHTGLMNALGTGVSGHNFIPAVFLNGQKTYSGISYVRNGGNYEWIDALDSTGKMFYLEMPNGVTEEVNTGQFDISGINFNKDCVNLYVNGMEQTSDIMLETAGVTPIDTGIVYYNTGFQNAKTQEYIFS